jgi:hypothetical protein
MKRIAPETLRNGKQQAAPLPESSLSARLDTQGREPVRQVPFDTGDQRYRIIGGR